MVQVACGALHSAAITSDGDLFTWGRGTEGQLGHASRHLPPELNDAITGVQLRPKPVPTFLATKKRQRPVAGVSCGVNFTLVVTRVGEVWAFGGGAMGQLGIGRLTRAGIPAVVMPSCPATGETFVEVAAGWAHSLARTSGGRVFSWGFNALGSLGLGDHRTRFLPEHVPLNGWQNSNHEGHGSTADEGGLPSKSPAAIVNDVAAVKIRASGNSSGALTAVGELFTWGSGTTGGLGHGGGIRLCQSCPERVEHVRRPRRVKRLAGAEVTNFALSGTGGVALVPLRVKSIEPTSGPMEAGCKVLIKGYGFWDSPDIVVKFTPASKGHKPAASRSAVGTYVRREAGRCRDGSGGGLELLSCTAPRFASPEAAYVEVRFYPCWGSVRTGGGAASHAYVFLGVTGSASYQTETTDLVSNRDAAVQRPESMSGSFQVAIIESSSNNLLQHCWKYRLYCTRRVILDTRNFSYSLSVSGIRVCRRLASFFRPWLWRKLKE